MSQFHSVATEFQLATRLEDAVPADWDGELATAQLPAFWQLTFAFSLSPFGRAFPDPDPWNQLRLRFGWSQHSWETEYPPTSPTSGNNSLSQPHFYQLAIQRGFRAAHRDDPDSFKSSWGHCTQFQQFGTPRAGIILHPSQEPTGLQRPGRENAYQNSEF
ncbi:hypothetical protein BJX68DRAFT_262999 [Aspergillus pseudodeflectus]|uniref:Uncharacterized protein n=1 Tax=Aspergillus pseudodeflectus TaxID=176178 RepID=A0ABR4KYV4_9EURO